MPAALTRTPWPDTTAEAELATIKPTETISVDDIEALIADVRDTWGDMATALGQADAADKCELLTALGVAVSYDPVRRHARITCTPAYVRVSCRRTDSYIKDTVDPQVRGPEPGRHRATGRGSARAPRPTRLA
jgi:hypothetical protein